MDTSIIRVFTKWK